MISDSRKQSNFFFFVGTRNGFNGGGISLLRDLNGGGASDVRLLDTNTTDSEIQYQSLLSRIIVAGGRWWGK